MAAVVAPDAAKVTTANDSPAEDTEETFSTKDCICMLIGIPKEEELRKLDSIHSSVSYERYQDVALKRDLQCTVE